MTTAPDPSAQPSQPFVGLNPFSYANRHYFFGRNQEIRLITSSVIADPHVVVFGPSGVGKSSIIAAGVLPRIQQRHRNAVCVLNRVWSAGFYDAIGSGLAKEAERVLNTNLSPGGSLDELIQEIAEEGGGPVVLVFDQFEDFFAHLNREQRAPLEGDLEAIVEKQSLDAHLLFGIRYDELGRLDQLRLRIPDIMVNAFELDYLSPEQAEEAIRNPIKAVDPTATVDDELVEDVISKCQLNRIRTEDIVAGKPIGTEPSGVNAPFLQLTLERVWRAYQEDKTAGLTITYKALGGVDQIVSNHFAEVISGLDENERLACARVFQLLVTPYGSKIAIPLADLARATHLDTASLSKILDELSSGDARLLRVAVPHKDPQQVRYEIMHDVLAPHMLKWSNELLASAHLHADRNFAAAMGALEIWNRSAATAIIASLVQDHLHSQPVNLVADDLGLEEACVMTLARRLAAPGHAAEAILSIAQAIGNEGGKTRIGFASTLSQEAARRWVEQYDDERVLGCMIDLRDRSIIELSGAALIGRSFQNDHLGDGRISRIHIGVYEGDPQDKGFDGEDAWVLDFRSVNGTTLNGRLLYYANIGRLHSGQIVTLANIAPLLFVARDDFKDLIRLEQDSGEIRNVALRGLSGLQSARAVVIDTATSRFALVQHDESWILQDGSVRIASRPEMPKDALLRLDRCEGGIEVRFAGRVKEAAFVSTMGTNSESGVFDLDPTKSYIVSVGEQGKHDERFIVGRIVLLDAETSTTRFLEIVPW